jgi:hypothetical protein
MREKFVTRDVTCAMCRPVKRVAAHALSTSSDTTPLRLFSPASVYCLKAAELSANLMFVLHLRTCRQSPMTMQSAIIGYGWTEKRICKQICL